MDVCSPKDGFVQSVRVKNGDSVSAGDVVLIMDSDNEERLLKSLVVFMKLQEIRNERYREPQASVFRGIIASTAQESEGTATAFDKAAKHVLGMNYYYGVVPQEFVNAVEASALQADLRRALDHRKVELYDVGLQIQRDLIIVSDKISQLQADLLRREKDDCIIHSPISGRVTLAVGPNSFVEEGTALFSVPKS